MRLFGENEQKDRGYGLNKVENLSDEVFKEMYRLSRSFFEELFNVAQSVPL